MKRGSQTAVYAMTVITLVLVVVAAVYTIMQKYRENEEGGAVTTLAGVTASPMPSNKPGIEDKETQKDNSSNNAVDSNNNASNNGSNNSNNGNNNSSSSNDTNGTVKGDNGDVQAEENEEDGIYTFLQGPKSWGERIDWSGQWGTKFYDGGSFGGFGCGLCCLANVYSTVSSCQCTPVDMYQFAKRNTGYSGGGAIAWEYMDSILKDIGIESHLRRKPGSYKAFRKQISQASCSIVLVSSKASRCYWKNTPGHYVAIFLYDKESDTVFLADSGNPDHNRQRVKLHKIYKSLKKASEWQYICAGDYNAKEDTWKHRRLNGRWVRPEYLS